MNHSRFQEFEGSAIITKEWKEAVPAILMAWYPGMEGGNAVARVVFGDVNQSGKLPFTVPKGRQWGSPGFLHNPEE